MGMTDVGPIFRSFGGSCAAYFNALLNIHVQQLSTCRSCRSIALGFLITYSAGAEFDLMNNDNGLITARVDYNYRDGMYLDVFQNSH